jgi:hypothetical protein
MTREEGARGEAVDDLVGEVTRNGSADLCQQQTAIKMSASAINIY